MDNKFTLLESNDDDVILFEQETFKVSRLKELLSKEIETKLNQALYVAQHQAHQNGTTITSTFRQVSISLENLNVDKIQVNFHHFPVHITPRS